MYQNDPLNTYTSTSYDRPEQEGAVKRMLVFSLIFLALLYHISQWGTDSFSIIYLRTSTTLGFASVSDYSKLHTICQERIKPSCLEGALYGKAKLSQNSWDYTQLGDFQRRKGQHVAAIQSYIAGSQNNSEVVDSRLYYGLAKSYEAIGQTDKAIESYAKAIESRPDVIQSTITEQYVLLLKKLGRTDDARAVIDEARERGNSDSFFSHL